MGSAIDPAERRALGTTHVRVSRLGIGGGSAFVRAGDESQALVDAAWQARLRHFDTAPLYGDGESEKRFGLALSRRPRDEYVLSTKVGREGHRVIDYGEQAVRASIERSCERIGVERIDIAFIHDVDPDMHGALFEQRFAQATTEAYVVLARLREAGRIAAIGARSGRDRGCPVLLPARTAGDRRAHQTDRSGVCAASGAAGGRGIAVSAASSGGAEVIIQRRDG